MTDEMQQRLAEAHARAVLRLHAAGVSTAINAAVAGELGRVTLAEVDDAVAVVFATAPRTAFDHAAAHEELAAARDALCELRRFLRLASSPDNGNTGLPCPDCGAIQKQVDMSKHPDGRVFVRVNYVVPAGDRQGRELRALAAIIRKFTT